MAVLMARLARRHLPFVGRTLVVLLLATAWPAGQSREAGEEDIKAAFLYNFAKYVEWPDGAFPAGVFQICVDADSAFEKRVDEIIAGETISGRPVMRQAQLTMDGARSCHILFLAHGATRHGDQLLAAVRGTPVLTVGDTADFLIRGGVLTFVKEGGRVRFDVNLVEAQRAGLAVSSRLLRVARRVIPAPQAGR
jgi:hypothetical protein